MWYTSAGLKPQCPFQLTEIHEKIRQGQLRPQDLIFNQESQAWKAAQEWQEIYRLGFPAFEAVGTEKNDELIWIVLRQDRADKKYHQEGPMDGQQIITFLLEGRLQGDDLVWKKGLSGWARLSDRAEFTSPDL